LLERLDPHLAEARIHLVVAAVLDARQDAESAVEGGQDLAERVHRHAGAELDVPGRRDRCRKRRARKP
jgi:hypothetical protein